MPTLTLPAPRTRKARLRPIEVPVIIPVSAPKRTRVTGPLSPTARAKLTPKALVWQVISKGVALGYRRAANAGEPGAWWVRWRDADAGRYVKQSFADADDLEKADGADVLDHGQAVRRAHEIVQTAGERIAASRVIAAQAGLPKLATVTEACERYAKTLEPRGGSAARDARASFKKWLGEFGATRLADVSATNAQLFAEQTPERVVTNVKAALNYLPAALRPPLAAIRAMNLKRQRRAFSEDEESVGDVPDDVEVARRVAAAHKFSPGFGAFAAAMAGTGVRPSQLARLRVRDLQRKPDGFELVVHPSEKGQGSGNKRLAHVPIGETLAKELVALTKGRARDAFLFTMPKKEQSYDAKTGRLVWHVVGEQPWYKEAWVRAARMAGFEGEFYEFRHARICKLIMAGVPLRLIAEHLDTSTVMIERSYSRWISTLGNSALRVD